MTSSIWLKHLQLPLTPERKILARCRLFAVAAVMFFSLVGCLPSVVHLTDGRITPPGASSLTWGAGIRHQRELRCPGVWEPWYNDSLKRVVCDGYWGEVLNSPPDTLTAIRPVGGVRRRIGAAGPRGSWPGLELGWRIEAGVPYATVGFEVRSGLPVADTAGPWKHSLGLGWDIGNWTDNTWSIDWAGSREVMVNPRDPRDAIRIHAGLRGSLAATMPNFLLDDEENALEEGEDLAFESDRQLMGQARMGLSYSYSRDDRRLGTWWLVAAVNYPKLDLLIEDPRWTRKTQPTLLFGWTAEVAP